MWAGQPCGRPHCWVPAPSLAWQSPNPYLEHSPTLVLKGTPFLERKETMEGAPGSSSSLPTGSPRQSAPEFATFQMVNSWLGRVAARCGRRGSRWLCWAEVTTSELAPREGICLAGPGAACPNTPHPPSPLPIPHSLPLHCNGVAFS